MHFVSVITEPSYNYQRILVDYQGPSTFQILCFSCTEFIRNADRAGAS